MIGSLLKKIFGTANERELKRIQVYVDQINSFEGEISGLADGALRAKTGEFRKRLENGEALDDLLPEAFAVVREASKRVLGMRHFDAQLVGGIVLHSGKIAEMKTGRGENPGGYTSRVSKCIIRHRRTCGHGERLSRAARRPMDGASV